MHRSLCGKAICLKPVFPLIWRLLQEAAVGADCLWCRNETHHRRRCKPALSHPLATRHISCLSLQRTNPNLNPRSSRGPLPYDFVIALWYCIYESRRRLYFKYGDCHSHPGRASGTPVVGVRRIQARVHAFGVFRKHHIEQDNILESASGALQHLHAAYSRTCHTFVHKVSTYCNHTKNVVVSNVCFGPAEIR